MSYRFNSEIFTWIFILLLPFSLTILLWEGTMIIFPIQKYAPQYAQPNLKNETIGLDEIFTFDPKNMTQDMVQKEDAMLTQFTLKAIYLEKEQSFAMVSYKNQTYLVKLDEIVEGYKLTHIESMYLLFEHIGKIYKLEMDNHHDKKQ
jgi:hypothetical protein